MKFKKFREVKTPTYGTDGAAAIDFYLPQDETIIGGELSHLVKLGIGVQLEKDEVMLLTLRSSVGLKTGVRMSNAIGVIDSDYRGEIGLILDNLREWENCDFVKDERIAQGLIVKVERKELEEVAELGETERGAGGFGSTGK